MVVMAAQTEASEAYGKLTSTSATSSTDKAALVERMNKNIAELNKLAEVKGSFTVTVDENAVVTKVVYINSGFTCTYNAKAVAGTPGKDDAEDAGYTVKKGGEKAATNVVN